MLHTETVAKTTLELLRQLMAEPKLNAFALVGGTNLSLRIGHRISDDIDLFTNSPFDVQKIKNAVASISDDYIKIDETAQSILYRINGIKVDMTLHQYPYLSDTEKIDEVRLASMEDVCAMKLNAVSNRGAKKDFWDIAALLANYSIKDMLSFFSGKYSNEDTGYVIRSLTYFEDAEMQPDPIALTGTKWAQVKAAIIKAVKDHIAEEIK